jgi:hypothetical protein
LHAQVIPGVFAGRPAKQVSDFLLDYARRWTALGRPPLESETASFLGARGRRPAHHGQGEG